MKKRFLFFFPLLIGTVFAEIQFNTFDIFVQPHRDTEFFEDGKKIVPKTIFKDNSLAKFKFKLNDESKTLIIKNKNFNSVSFSKDDFSKKNNFVVLQKLNSIYKTINVFITGVHPKSVRFVNNNTVVIALLQDNGIDVINIETGEKKRISPPPIYAKKQGFVESLILPHKNELWVSQMSTACIHIFDTVSFEYKTTIKTTGQWSKVMAYNSISNRVYLSNWISHNISVIDPDKKVEEKKIKTKAVPRGMAFSQNGKFIYCAQFENSKGTSNCKLLKKELNSFKIIAERGKPGAKRHIVADYNKNRLYVSDMLNGIIEVYSLKDDSLISTIKVFSHPNTIVLSPDGSILYVSCRGSNNPVRGYLYKGFEMGTLDVIDTDSLKLIDRIEAGNQPTGLDISPDGKRIVLSDFLDNRIRIIEMQD